MDDIVYRDGLPCKRVQHGWNVRIWESALRPLPEGTALRGGPSRPSVAPLGTGQREMRIWPRVLYVPVSEERRLFDASHPETGQDWAPDIDLEALAEKAERAKVKSAARAKRTCRWKIKHAGFNQLLTLTYRENMVDYDRMRRDFAAFLRKMRKLIPGFRSVYAFEPQERGAWHAHACVDRLPMVLQYKGVKIKSFDAARAVWRSIVGHDNGTVNVDGHMRRMKRNADQRKRSLAKMAAYVAKYLTKDHEAGQMGRNRWGSTQDLTPPKAISLQLPPCAIEEAIAIAFERKPGHRIVSHSIGQWGDTWMLYTEPELACT